MKEKLKLKRFLFSDKGTRLLLSIDNGQYSFTELYHDVLHVTHGTLHNHLRQVMNSGLVETIERKGGSRVGKKKHVYQLTEEGEKITEEIKKICRAKQTIEEIIKTL